MRVALIDYRAGNLTSVKNAFAAVGADLFVPSAPGELDAAAGSWSRVSAISGRPKRSRGVDARRSGGHRGRRPLLGIVSLGM